MDQRLTTSVPSHALPQLWLAKIESALPPGATSWLDGDERARLGKMSHAGAMRARVVAWCLRRWALSQARPDIVPEAWRFVSDPGGKPRLAPHIVPEIHHSISHGGLIAAVLIDSAPCGVDVEARPAGLEAGALVFGTRERAAIAAHPHPAERFLQHWVFKEAVLKLLGTGLMADPDLLELAIAPDGRSARSVATKRHGPGLPGGLTLQAWPLANAHHLAAAFSHPSRIEPRWAPWSDPMSFSLLAATAPDGSKPSG